mgnify:CR=1 FL=1
MLKDEYKVYEEKMKALEVYEEKMQALADKKYRCGCPPCRAFREYARAVSDDVKKRFTELGLDIEDPVEAFDIGKDEQGNTMYVGWWNIYGRIIKNSEKTCRLSDGFEVSFLY